MKRVSFYVAYADGLVLQTGDEFKFDGMSFVVHKGREPFEKEYRVSERQSGCAIPIPKTSNKKQAIQFAMDIFRSQPPGHLKSCLKQAEEIKAGLKVIQK